MSERAPVAPLRVRLALVVLVAATEAACGDSSGPSADADAQPMQSDLTVQIDASPDSEAQLPLPEPGGPGHPDVAAKLGAKEVRAGVVTDPAQLLQGIKVTGRVGDYKIYNDRVAFIIAAARETDGYSLFGGEVLDAQRLDDPAASSLLGETILTVGFLIPDPSSVTVVEDGSDGERAVVRAIGKLSPFAYVEAIIPVVGSDMPADVVVDYVLEPGSDALEIRQRIFLGGEHEVRVPVSAAALLAGDGAGFFIDEGGFDVSSSVKRDHVGMVGRDVSYALVALDTLLQPLVTYAGIWVVSSGSLTLPPNEETVRRFKLGVGEGSPEGFRRLIRRIGGVAEPAAVRGTVTDPAGDPVEQARVHVREEDGDYVTMARTDDAGHYELALDPGHYVFAVAADGRALQDGVAVIVESTPLVQDLQAGPAAELSFTVVDGSGAEIPAKLAFVRQTPLVAPPASFGEQRFPHDRALILFHRGGPATVQLPPGEYAVTVSRGFEYEIDTATVVLTAGGTENVDFVLVRSVDTTGYMCGDFHLHAMWSPDSNDLYEHKVSAFVAEGLEIAVATDHEYIADYSPYIAKLGLQKWVRGLVGEELTTQVYGHFNAFPITADERRPNRGAVVWQGSTAPQVFAEVHQRWPGTVLQVNHPRAQAIGGYMTFVGYDPDTGEMARAADWSAEFEAIEVANAARLADTEEALRDWYSLLDRGHLVAGTGNSDSHEAYRSEVGYPRNFVKLSRDDPAALDPAELAEAVRGQRLVVSAGPFVTASVGEASVGDTAPALEGKASLQIMVQAPLWIPVDQLRVISSGGSVLHDLVLDASTANPTNPVVRYEGTLEVAASVDAWVVVRVDGKQAMAPVMPSKRPFAITNPIFLDVDGNGAYDPPKSFP